MPDELQPFAECYRGSVYPPNTLLDAGGSTRVPERSHFIETQRQTIGKLIDDEVI